MLYVLYLALLLKHVARDENLKDVITTTAEAISFMPLVLQFLQLAFRVSIFIRPKVVLEQMRKLRHRYFVTRQVMARAFSEARAYVALLALAILMGTFRFMQLIYRDSLLP